MNYKDDIEAFNSFNQKLKQINAEIGKVIVGQDEVIRDLLISIYSNGHCLLVGVPGLAKTLMVNTLAKVLGFGF
jgi:MoxR-like ATPase